MLFFSSFALVLLQSYVSLIVFEGAPTAMKTETNKRAAGKGGIPSLLTIERARPALPEHFRSV